MILDVKNQFCALTECTNSKSLGALDLGSIAEAGKGSPLYVHVFSDGGFSTGSEVFSIYIKTGSTSPGDNQELAIGPFSAAEASLAGRVGVAALPAKNLEQYISAYFYAKTALTAGGKLRVELAPHDG
jgi:hypothetical protein